MRFQHVKGNIIYAISLLIVTLGILYIDFLIRTHANVDLTVIPYLIFLALSYPLIGITMGFPFLRKNKRNEGWTINPVRLIFLVMPMFFLANIGLLINLFRDKSMPALADFAHVFSMYDPAIYIFQILFGFMLITCFDSKERSSQQK